MIDTHAHLDTEAFAEDLPETVERAVAAGVKSIIIPGIEPKSFANIKKISDSYPFIYSAYGIHPHESSETNNDDFDAVERYAVDSKCKAIGEIGLDYFYDFSPRGRQIEVFSRQISIARNLSLPVIVHNREADEDVLRIIKTEGKGHTGVLHCFSSDTNTLREVIDSGYYVSFTGNITFKKTDLTETVKLVPCDRIMIETDSPYMAPVPYRGKRNEPARIIATAEKIAEIKNLSIEEVIRMTTENANRLFKLFCLVFCFAAVSMTALSQNSDAQSSEQSDDLITPIQHPLFEKKLGLGFTIGSLTAIDNYYLKTNTEQRSNEGIFSVGGRVVYGINKFLLIDASYLYAKNKKPMSDPPEGNLSHGPTIHQFFDLSSRWIANPEGRINFYATCGLSYIMNHYDKDGIPDFEHQFNALGFNAGLGFFVNFDIKGAGLFVLTAEWKLNMAFKRTNTTYYSRSTSNVKIPNTEMSTLYSLPQFGLVFYPEFITNMFH